MSMAAKTSVQRKQHALPRMYSAPALPRESDSAYCWCLPEQAQSLKILPRPGLAHTMIHSVALAAAFWAFGLITAPITSTAAHCRLSLKLILSRHTLLHGSRYSARCCRNQRWRWKLIVILLP